MFADLDVMLPVGAVAVGAGISGAATWAARRIAVARGFVDRPGGHKGHARPVALGGGAAITAAAIVPIVLTVAGAHWTERAAPEWAPALVARHAGGIVSKTPMALAIAGCAILMCVMGTIDDARPIRASIKFAVQAVVAGVLVIGFDLRLMSHAGYAASTALSMLWILTLTNSFNFLDNMDGLAGGVALIAASVFGTSAMMAGQIFVPACCWLLAGAVLGFLPFNFHPATIYMGDGGSLVLGLLLGVFTILTTFADPEMGQRPYGLIAPLVVMAVPLYDTASVFFLRWRSGVAIWTGDRRHFSHRLVRRGMGVRRAVLVIWLATAVTALPALLLPTADWTEAAVIAVQTVLVVGFVALLESSGPHDATRT